MRQSILTMVNSILSDMDSEPVDTLSDSDEAGQVASMIKDSYYAMMSNREWPHLRRGVNLDPFSVATHPTHMRMDENITQLLSLNYNKVKLNETRNRYEEITFISNDDFLRVTNKRNNDNSDVLVVLDASGIQLNILNDKQPTYYTSFDDENVVFDSFDSEVEANLMDSKVQATAFVMPDWEESEDFIPDLPANAFTALLEEAKSRAFYRLKQMSDPKAEKETARQQAYLSRQAKRINRGQVVPNYGRNR